MRKRMAIVLLILIILCGCGAHEIPPSEPVKPESVSGLVWNSFRDMSGESVVFDHIKRITLNYALGWNLDQEGYIKLEPGTVFGNYIVTAASAGYFIQRDSDDRLSLVCDQTSYLVECQESIPGILQIADDTVQFFPYEDPGNNLLFIHYRQSNDAEIFAESSIVSTGNGDTIRIQPVGISLAGDNSVIEESIITELLPFDNEASLRWYDVNIRFNEIQLLGFCDGEGIEVFRTNVIGCIYDADFITINRQLQPTEVIRPEFMYRF